MPVSQTEIAVSREFEIVSPGFAADTQTAILAGQVIIIKVLTPNIQLSVKVRAPRPMLLVVLFPVVTHP